MRARPPAGCIFRKYRAVGRTVDRARYVGCVYPATRKCNDITKFPRLLAIRLKKKERNKEFGRAVGPRARAPGPIRISGSTARLPVALELEVFAVRTPLPPRPRVLNARRRGGGARGCCAGASCAFPPLEPPSTPSCRPVFHAKIFFLPAALCTHTVGPSTDRPSSTGEGERTHARRGGGGGGTAACALYSQNARLLRTCFEHIQVFSGTVPWVSVPVTRRPGRPGGRVPRRWPGPFSVRFLSRGTTSVTAATTTTSAE